MPLRPRKSAGARILVVDDDPRVRWVTVECLREVGQRWLEPLLACEGEQ